MQTLWNSRDTLPAYPPLREDLHADAAVVGGGMAGILTAYALHTRGLRVVLLEGSRLARDRAHDGEDHRAARPVLRAAGA